MTKTELERAVADAAGVEKRTAAAVLDALEEVVTSNVRKGDAVIIRPGFIKVSRKDVKARKAREGTNPFTGEPTVFKARPASKTAKVAALQRLKDAVGAKRGPSGHADGGAAGQADAAPAFADRVQVPPVREVTEG